MKTSIHPVRLVARVASAPIRLIGHGIGHLVPSVRGLLHRKAGQIVLGVAIGLIGCALASVEQHIVPHFVQEFAAYTIHGLGVAPMIEHGLGLLGLLATPE